MSNSDLKTPIDSLAQLIAGGLLASSVMIAIGLPAVVGDGGLHQNRSTAELLQVVSLVLLGGGLVLRKVLGRLITHPLQAQIMRTLIPFAVWEASVILASLSLLTGGESMNSYILSGLAIGTMLINWPRKSTGVESHG